jgi:hypothetical protein
MMAEISPADQKLFHAIDDAHRRAMLGTLYIDTIAIFVSDSQAAIDAGDDPTAEIGKAIESLAGLVGNTPRMPESVRGYFSKVAGQETVRFDCYELEAPSAHAVAYQLIQKVLSWGEGVDLNANSAPRLGCEYLRAALEKEIDLVRDELNYMPDDIGMGESDKGADAQGGRKTAKTKRIEKAFSDGASVDDVANRFNISAANARQIRSRSNPKS